MKSSSRNKHDRVVEGFGAEWSHFTQEELPPDERRAIFEDYFSVFPWDALSAGASGANIGCGTIFVEVEMVDATEAKMMWSRM